MRTHLGAWILIFVGVVFLLINFGVISPNSWNFVIRLWPLILVFIGLRIALGRSPAAAKLVAIIKIATLVVILLMLLAPTNPGINNFLNQYLPWLPKPDQDVRFDNQPNNSDLPIQ